MNRPIRRAALVLLAAFLALATVATYWQVFAAERLRDDPRNTRSLLARTGRQRGSISSSEGLILARSVREPDDARRFRRRYPHDDLYAHTVGFSSLLGDFGLEESYAEQLSSGRDFTVSGALNALLGQDTRARSMQLTLHHGLTRTAADALGGRTGAAAALDPRTGAVLALAASPRFDANAVVGPEAEAAWEDLSEDPARPLLNRATGAAYPPGSVFTVLAAALALERGTARPDSFLPNRTAPSPPGEEAACGPAERNLITLEEAFIWSCDEALAQLAADAGADALTETARRFGFNRPLPLDIPLLPSTLPAADSYRGDRAAVAQTALGQREVQATALQMALVAAATANEGKMMEPQLVARIFDGDGEVAFQFSPRVFSEPLRLDSALSLTTMMERAVARGGGVRARIPGVRVAGKTGLASAPDGEPVSWFIGFAPADYPEIAVAVVVASNDGENSPDRSAAAPIAAEMMEFWLRGRTG